MAEQTGHQHQHPVAHVYLGEGKAEPPKKEVAKADTLYNKHMQEIFDVMAPEAAAERVDAVNAQGEIADLTAELLSGKKNSWQRYKEHGDLKKFINELDVEWRGRELPHKLERVLLFTTMGAVSAGLDLAGDVVTDTVLKKRPGLFYRKGKPLISMDPEDSRGNRKALTKGWEMITDTLVGSFSDLSVRTATNRTDVAFVSPLSAAVSRIGTIAAGVALPENTKFITKFVNSVTNPGTIEAGFRTLAAIPVIGAKMENIYIALNKRILGGSGIFPFGFDVAVAMLAAKESQIKSVETTEAVVQSKTKQ